MLLAAACTACEKPITDDLTARQVTFVTVGENGTLRTASESFSRLNFMVYDADGFRLWSKVRTQVAPSDSFGTVNISLPVGTHYLLAVGHSSDVSATLSGPQDVRFTASDGQKLTDTFSYLGTLTAADTDHTLFMQRVSAMFRLVMTDSILPSDVHRLRFDYKGGSANFNPITLHGITKSTQSEVRRIAQNGVYEVFTFPYMADECLLQVTVSALDALDNVVCSRHFLNVPVKRNYVTSFTGQFFSSSDNGTIDASQTSMSFSVDEWQTMYNFTF